MREFPDRTALASALAAAVRDVLQARLAGDGRAALAVSGGTTPVAFFELLARERLDWARVTVTLVDDRCVPESSDRSNVRLVIDKFFSNLCRLPQQRSIHACHHNK